MVSPMKTMNRASNSTPPIRSLARGAVAPSKTLIEKFNLDSESDPQTYGIGIKELWEVDPEKHDQGAITHTVGWPMETDTYGGSFIIIWKIIKLLSDLSLVWITRTLI